MKKEGRLRQLEFPILRYSRLKSNRPTGKSIIQIDDQVVDAGLYSPYVHIIINLFH